MDKQLIQNTIANNLKKIMRDKNILSSELSKKCDISSGMISKLVNGNTGITITLALALAEGLDVDITDIIDGLSHEDKKFVPAVSDENEFISVGIISLYNRRTACALDSQGNVIGRSALQGTLDLAEPTSVVMAQIKESIKNIFNGKDVNFKLIDLKLVTQSFEFRNTRSRFINYVSKYFNSALIMPDWQLSHIYTYDKSDGVIVIVDKGSSLSYRNGDSINKIGGWKFPVYDVAGANWIGNELVKHSVEAFEGFVEISPMASELMDRFDNKIENLIEYCFKGNEDVFSEFVDIVIKHYLMGDAIAKKIIEFGASYIYGAIHIAMEKIGKDAKVLMLGSLKDIYKPLLKDVTFHEVGNNLNFQVELLARMNDEVLLEYGINNQI